MHLTDDQIDAAILSVLGYPLHGQERHQAARVVRAALAMAQPDTPCPPPKDEKATPRPYDPDPFNRGFSAGLSPLCMSRVRIVPAFNGDFISYRLGGAQVEVSALEQMQADSLQALGYSKGCELRRKQP